MFRHTALFLLRDDTDPAQLQLMLRGLAFLRMECPTVVAGDYGEDLFGGSRAAGSYDVALHLDFADAQAYASYVAHPAHVEVSNLNASLSVTSRTARIDWVYEGEPRTRRGAVRHCALFTFAPWADVTARAGTLEAARGLAATRGVASIAVGPNGGEDPRASDWLLDMVFDDEQAAQTVLAGADYAATMALVDAATLPAQHAAVTHRMRGG